MKLKKAILSHFGKFRGFEIDFNEDLHVLYGHNEAGKTTILHFIEGMLYGFYDPFKKGRRVYPIHARYMPSDGIYQGVLLLEQDKKTYRIERDFKNHDVKVFIAKTGNDITDTLPYSTDLKQADLAKWLEMPYPLFLNTVRITQSDMDTSSDAESELFKRLSNLKKTKSTQFSGDGALKYLKDIKDSIGTKSAPTKPYAKALKAKETLKAEKKALEEKAKELETLGQKTLAIEDELTTKTIELETLNAALMMQTKREIAERIKPIYEDFGSKFKTYDFKTIVPALFDQLSQEKDLETLISLQDSLDLTPKKPDSYIDQQAFDGQLETLEAQINEAHSVVQNLQDISRKIELTEEALSHLEMEDAPIKPKLSWTVIFLVPLFVYLIEVFKYQSKKRQFDQKYAYVQKESNRLKEVLRDLNQEKTKLESSNPSVDVNALDAQKAILNTNRAQSEDYELAQKVYDSTLQKIESLKETLKPTFERLKWEGEDFSRLVELFEMGRNVKSQLGRFDLDEILTVMHEPFEPLDMARLESLKETVKRLENERSALNVKKASLIESLSAYESIVSELEDHKADLKRFDATLKTVKKAESLLLRSIDIIEENFAPALAEAIESHLKVLTLGRYETLKVRKDLQFKVEDLEGTLKSSNHFSTATLDQIHLSIRLGILDVLGLEEMPLILDDAFMHFDKERLNAILKLLPNLKRQVILLTAHERESVQLKALNLNFERTDLNG